ncbi:MAG: hypothetical protein JO295_05715 [Verrucomicrobia bacterium]|nr:hypothetical protein [Verrucomicrobiota bacterium]
MTKRETNRRDMFRRVAKFGADRPAKFPAAKLSGKSFAAVAAAADTLDAAEKGQVTGSGSQQSATANAATLTDALRLDILKVVRTARAVALDEPGFEKEFLPPDDNSVATLLATARAFIEKLNDADTLKKFTDHDFDATTILDRMEVNADDLAAAGTDQDTGSSGHVTATQAAHRAVQSGMKACLRLDAIVDNVLGDDPDEIARWHQARHTLREPARKKRAASKKTTSNGGSSQSEGSTTEKPSA